jgi:hypothetical protein
LLLHNSRIAIIAIRIFHGDYEGFVLGNVFVRFLPESLPLNEKKSKSLKKQGKTQKFVSQNRINITPNKTLHYKN